MGERTKILIVEDESDLLELLVLVVTSSGYETHAASDGLQALAMLESQPVDLVLCDMNMPGMDGVALLNAVRASGSKVPFIFITGEDSQEMRHHAAHLEVAKYLQKPFDLKAVRSVIEAEVGPERAA